MYKNKTWSQLVLVTRDFENCQIFQIILFSMATWQFKIAFFVDYFLLDMNIQCMLLVFEISST